MLKITFDDVHRMEIIFHMITLDLYISAMHVGRYVYMLRKIKVKFNDTQLSDE